MNAAYARQLQRDQLKSKLLSRKDINVGIEEAIMNDEFYLIVKKIRISSELVKELKEAGYTIADHFPTLSAALDTDTDAIYYKITWG